MKEEKYLVKQNIAVGARKRGFDDVGRENSSSETPARKLRETYTKDETHWIVDGNVLLQIGNTRFKLHKSRLAGKSPWFRDLWEQHAGVVAAVPNNNPCYPDIQRVLRSAEMVDDMDLFFLSFANGPNAEQFGKLLTAMQCGIDYTFNPPSFEDLADIYVASSYFLVDRYRKFVVTYLQKMFPDSWSSVRSSPFPFSIRALLLGFLHTRDLSSIVRPCFYDLVRTPPFPVPEPNNTGSNTNNSVTLSSLDLSNVKPEIFICLMNAQRHLVQVWDKIPRLLSHECSEKTCNFLHQGITIYQKSKQNFLFDPILGIGQILGDIASSKTYCENVKSQVSRNLISQADATWADIKTWIGNP